jgi:DNA invertase Pin-like site-specific DNA recombinase
MPTRATQIPDVLAGTEAVPAAQYVRMSTDHQRYSIENQQALIQAFAGANNMEIVRTYMDAGKSGLTLRGRSGLSSLLADVVSGTAPFKAILVYDVSRWGRFQDADESAHYEFLCRRAGIKLVYCAEQFSSDATPLGNILKSLKRAMAGEFSRELGVKVAAGKARIGKLGFRIGGIAGFGLRRQLLADGKTPGMVLGDRQRKSIQTDRVTLVPGPSEEIDLVRRMYVHYVYLGKSERHIANDLNEEGHTFFGRPWTRALVRNVLSNEKYIGNNVVGRVSSRLYTRQVSNPSDKWTRCEGAFVPIVSRSLFDSAEVVRRFNEKTYVTHEQILKGLRAVLKREGMLSAAIINKAPELPSANTVGLRFGTLGQAYEKLGYLQEPRYRHHKLDRELMVRRSDMQRELLTLLEAQGVFAWASRPGVLACAGAWEIEAIMCRWQRRHEHDTGWRISYHRNHGTDFLLAARLDVDHCIKDLLLVPRADLARLPIFLRASHQGLLAPYTYKSLDAVAKKIGHSFRAASATRFIAPGSTSPAI